MQNILNNVRNDIEEREIHSAINSREVREAKRIAKNIKINAIRTLRKQYREVQAAKQNIVKTFQQHEKEILIQINKLKAEINRPIN